MSETKDFKIERGATWNIELTFENNDDTPADFSGVTSVEFQIRNEIKDPATVKLLSLSNGITKVGNILKIELTAVETAELVRDYYHYKLVLGFGAIVYIPISGRLDMNDGGTQ